MQLIFFQNCISPHQLPYIQQLSEFDNVERVVYVAPVVTISSREGMGWSSKVDDNNSIEYIIAPSQSDVESLFKECEYNAYLFFSGITAFPDVEKWFKMSLDYHVKRAIITEPPFVYSKPLWMHAFRFLLNDYRYIKYIDKLFLMGTDYLWYYKKWSKKWDVIPFRYCTKWVDRTKPIPSGNKIKLLFVGSLSKRKNVKLVIDAFKKIPKDKQQQLEFGIIGSGEEELVLKNSVSGLETNVVFYGKMPMEKVSFMMQEYDILILPSKHDGWGAVVNEALTLGLYVICSDKCGAKSLLSNSILGKVFVSENSDDLAKTIEEIPPLFELRANTDQRIIWSKNNISPSVVAQTLLSHLDKQET
ncbi:MAG: glycosyltransferase family 4 protein [Prevotella sp.]|nr:glycosyltransferase family 4 protein [Prevotella sp.]